MRGGRLGLLLLALGTHPAAAQVSAAVDAQVQVSSVALSIATVANLDFQQVLPGIPVSIDPRTSPTAGEFEVHGTPNVEFTLNFTLPAVLSTGAITMPVSFATTDACAVRGRTVGRGGCQRFDPNVTFTDRFPGQAPPRNVWVFWLGGTVNPAPGQSPGVYTGVVTMDAAYTGN